MTDSMTAPSAAPRRPGRSVLAVFLGFVTVFVLSLGTDQVFHLLGLYPPWGEPMFDPGLNFLALAYRCVYQVIGGFIMARFAPSAPVAHALAGGVLGLILCILGAIAMIPKGLGPAWYPIALTISAVPTSWLGGVLFMRRQAGA
jgi:hypothetical protein